MANELKLEDIARLAKEAIWKKSEYCSKAKLYDETVMYGTIKNDNIHLIICVEKSEHFFFDSFEVSVCHYTSPDATAFIDLVHYIEPKKQVKEIYEFAEKNCCNKAITKQDEEENIREDCIQKVVDYVNSKE